MAYEKTVWIPGVTPIGDVYLNHLETQYDEAMTDLGAMIIEERNRNLAIEAEQNVNIWQLEAHVIAARENMDGWQGEGFFVDQNEISVQDDNLRVHRGIRQADGFVEGIVSAGFSTDAVTITSPPATSYVRCAVWTPTQDQVIYWADSVGFKVYNWDGATFTAAPVLPDQTGTTYAMRGLAIDVGSDGTQWLAASYESSTTGTHVWIYKRDPASDLWSFVTRLTGISANTCRECAWGPNAEWVAFGYNHYSNTTGTSYVGVRVYQRSGDTFTNVTLPSTPDVAGWGTVWRGDYLIVGTSDTNAPIQAWKLVGSTFTKLSVPAPAVGLDRIHTLSANSDGTHILATGYPYSGTPYVLERSGDSFSVVTGKFPTAPTSRCGTMSFSPDDQWITIVEDNSAASTTTWLKLYQYDKATHTYAPASQNPITVGYIPSNPRWSPDTRYLVFGHSSNPYLYVYEGQNPAGDVPTSSLTLNAVTLPSTCNAIYVLDDFVQTVGTGISRSYEVSLDGGTTWETITDAQIGSLITLAHSGTSMIVRLVMSHALGDESKARVYWFAAFATSV